MVSHEMLVCPSNIDASQAPLHARNDCYWNRLGDHCTTKPVYEPPVTIMAPAMVSHDMLACSFSIAVNQALL